MSNIVTDVCFIQIKVLLKPTTVLDAMYDQSRIYFQIKCIFETHTYIYVAHRSFDISCIVINY